MKLFYHCHSRACGNPLNNIFKWIPTFVGMTFVSFLIFIFPSGVFAQTAILSLDPSTGTFNRGCSFTLNVNLDTGGTGGTGGTQTDGSDAIIFYDPTRFNATSITNGTIYPDYPGNNIDPTGKITISGLASVSTPFAGKGTLAIINFTVGSNAPTGAVQIKFDFDPIHKAETRDSNVVERGTVVDVLNSVVDGNYTIGTGTCDGQVATPTPRPGRGGPIISTPAAQPKTLDQFVDKQGKGPGTPQLTSTLAIFGSVLTVLGILGLALL